MFVRLGSVLKIAPKRTKTPSTFLALQVRQAAKEVIDKVMADYPEEVAKKVKVKTFKNNTLFIVCPTLMSAELHARSEGLRDDINKTLGREIIKKFRFRKS